MPRKTGYNIRSAQSTLVLGNPEVGTSAWTTEYDEEYTPGSAREEPIGTPAPDPARTSLRTPRSLKKGYVQCQDYEKLDDQYQQALAAYQDLHIQLGALEQRIATMQGSEGLFLKAVEDQHALIDTLQKQIAALTESLGKLMGGVERNRSLMALMNTLQESPPAPADTARKVMQESEVPRRLAALEAKIGDMADAIVALSRSQHQTTSRPHPLAQPAANGRGGQRLGWQRSDRRRSAEGIERLPNPLQYTARSSTWRP